MGNHGGLYTQFFALAVGDLQLMRAMVYVKKDADGNIYFDKNNKTELEEVFLERFNGKFNKDERIGVNGILNDMDLAAKNIAEQTGGLNNDEGGVLGYNPTHGALGDLLESGFDKLFDSFGVRSGTARDVNRFLEQVSQERGIESLTVAGHSQGGLLLKRGLEGVKFEGMYIGKDGVYQPRNLRIQWSGSPTDAKETHRVAEEAGFKNIFFQVNRPEGKNADGSPKTDFVSDILGGNYKYSEAPDDYEKGGWKSFPSLLGNKSPHSGYSCSVCKFKELDAINRQVRERYINPMLIDKDGNYRKRD